MAIITGNDGKIKLSKTAGGAIDTTQVAAVRNFSIELKRDTIETTSMGKDVREYINGLSSWSGSADIYFDSASTSGHLDYFPILNPTSGSVGATTASVELYVGPSNSGKFAGYIIITGFSIKSSMDGMVEASISFQGSGACVFTA
jgi:predicted secreted protein